jgi:sterol desaturase/sphingolipid hydroxylase (fatty acid hydroxylase superfamily)/alpha-tubulin suppressor-like RCC1 family protein
MLYAAAAAIASLALLAVVFVPLERVFPARPGQPVFRSAFTVDLCFFFGQYLLWSGASIWVLSHMSGALRESTPEAARAFLAMQPLWLKVFLGVVLGDVLVYWFHRACHQFEWLWRFHAVHHSAPHLDWLAAHREHPVDGILTQLCANLPVIAMGLPAKALAGVVMFRTLWAVFIHSNVRLPLGPLRVLCGAPELHHYHHARDPEATYNFANLAPWIDVLFGTYQCPEGEETYELGLAEPWPKGYAAQLAHPFALERLPLALALIAAAVAGCSREAPVAPTLPSAEINLGGRPGGEAPSADETSTSSRAALPHATQISVGLAHGCARMADGTAYCWGENSDGQLGDNTNTNTNTNTKAPRDGMVRVKGVAEVEEVVAGFYASCARLRSGAVMCWGGNQGGELGDGSNLERSGPVRVVGVERARGIALGTTFGCALIDDGSVRCWGSDPILVPGPDRTYVAAPRTAQPIPRLADITRIASSFDAVCAVRRDGALLCWGRNGSGQLGFGSVEHRKDCSVGPVEARVVPDHVSEPQVVPNVTDVIDVALGSQRTCALRKDGSVWCSNDPRAPGHGGRALSGDMRGAKQLALYWPYKKGHLCGVFDGGKVRCAGTNDRGQLGDGSLSGPFDEVARDAAVSSAVEVRCGQSSTCARTEDGAIFCWEASDSPTFAQQVTPAKVRRIGRATR